MRVFSSLFWGIIVLGQSDIKMEQYVGPYFFCFSIVNNLLSTFCIWAAVTYLILSCSPRCKSILLMVQKLSINNYQIHLDLLYCFLLPLSIFIKYTLLKVTVALWENRIKEEQSFVDFTKSCLQPLNLQILDMLSIVEFKEIHKNTKRNWIWLFLLMKHEMPNEYMLFYGEISHLRNVCGQGQRVRFIRFHLITAWH